MSPISQSIAKYTGTLKKVFIHSFKVLFPKTGELFRILYGIERPGDNLTRDYTSTNKAEAAGAAACRLEKPPIADQMHVILWVIKANDIRFQTGKYREIIKFVQYQLRKASE